MVTFRAVGTVGLERPPLETAGVEGQGESSRLGSRPAYFASVGDFVAADVHAGDRVMPGASFHGPVIIQRMGDTVVIPPGAEARMDRRRNLIIEWRDAIEGGLDGPPRDSPQDSVAPAKPALERRRITP